MHHVYLLRCDSGKRYIGDTTDLKRRLLERNNHKNISTAMGEKWKLIYCETHVNKMNALCREKFLTGGLGWKFMKEQLKHYLEERCL